MAREEVKRGKGGPVAGRFFARVRSFDIACPRCDTVYLVGKGHLYGGRVWNPRTYRFECDRCGLTLDVGILAWRVGPGPSTPPPDCVPSVAQAGKIREQIRGHLRMDLRRKGDPVNELREGKGGKGGGAR